MICVPQRINVPFPVNLSIKKDSSILNFGFGQVIIIYYQLLCVCTVDWFNQRMNGHLFVWIKEGVDPVSVGTKQNVV